MNYLIAIVIIFVSVLLSEADGYFWSLWGAPITDQQQQQGLEDVSEGSVYASHPRNIRFTPSSGMLNDDPDTSAAFQELMPKVRFLQRYLFKRTVKNACLLLAIRKP